jgi:type I restriction enzyme S subunit
MNNIPKGYKQTKIGVIPEEWEETILSSFIKEKIIYCNDMAVELGSLTIEHGVIPKPIQYQREHLVKDTNNAYKLVKYNDFVYNPMNLRFGALALYQSEKPLKVSAYYNIFNVDENIVDIYYIYAYLKSEKIMFYYNRMATGSLEEKKRVHFKEFKKFIFPLPPLKEQQKIAKILTTWDSAISKQEELIKEKEKLKKGLMQKLLSGEVRFKEFSDEWETIKLGEYIYEINKRNKDKKVFLVLTVSAKYGFITQEDYFERSVASKDISNYKIVKKGEFAYNPSRINVGSISYLTTFDKGILSPMYIVFHCSDDLDSKYFLHWLNSYNFTGNLYKYLSGSVRDSLSFKDMKLMTLKLPPLQEQQKIADILSTADREIELLKKELEELKKQKKGLMQKLLTGEVRVKV